MKKFKTALVAMLVVMMTLSSAVFGLTGVSAAKTDLPTLEVEKPANKVPERLVNPEDPSETVRIIVELEKAPTIEAATQKGVLYKDLPESEKTNLETAVESDQATVQSAIKKAAPSVTYLENFTTVFNGFSAEVAAGQVAKIGETSGVKSVYEATEYTRPSVQPEMKYSKDLVQAQEAWGEYGYKGEGMVVGVIDTGIDPSHKDMVLTDDSTGDITKAELEALLADDSIENGEYFTAKVPFGWNYMDNNNQILDLGPEASMHGMHVAGTVGANGDEESETFGVKGVAPEAQLLALKVFGNDPEFASTYGDIYVKAIDDSIKLGADVINMSLGSVSGFVDSTHPEQMAVARSTENGILVAISAGNSDLYGSDSATFPYNYTEHQDYGLTGSPSVSEDSFGVASFENDIVTALALNYQVNGTDAGQAMYLLANDADPRDLPNATYEVMDAGLGTAADFAGKDFTGKFALVSRGEIAFTEKGLNAQAAGAAGVIVYNNAAGTINMQSDAAIKIPYMSALQADGLAMKAQIDAGNTVTVSFEGNFLETQNPAAGEMSDFTSWGPTPNLDFKPEITAPGGNIFSTLNNNEYGLMSGTSMAAPHVAGGTALVFQRVDAEFGLTGADRVQFAKNLMMNTAETVELAEGQFVSPRRQGAGLMQLHDALSTDVVVTNKSTGEAKVALKEIDNNQYSFTLVAENFSDEAAQYEVDVNVQVDAPVNAGFTFVTNPNTFGSVNLTDEVSIAAPESVTVPANGTVEIPVTVDISAIDEEFSTYFTQGFFVDGFVTLTDTNEEVTGNSSLVVPYFGFNGEWDDARIFDYFAWDDMAYYGYNFLTDGEGFTLNGGTHLEGYDPEKFAFSPNGDGDVDSVIPVFSLFRNAKEFEVNILNEAGTKIRTIRTAENLTKHYSSAAPYTFNPNYSWDGKANGRTVADGNYQIQLRAVIDYPNAEWQSIEFPVKVDTVAPEAKANFNAATKTVEVTEFTDNTGTDRWEVFLNGEELTENPTTTADESLAPSTTQFAVTADLKKTDELVAVFYDVAGNKTEVDLRVTGEEGTHPVIFIDTPGVTETFDTNEVEVTGTVEDDSNVVSVTVNGEEADTFDGVNFKHALTFEDGVHAVKVKAVDEFENEMEIQRQILVDTTVATVEVTEAPESVDLDTNEAEVSVSVQDNFDDIVVYVNDSEVYRNALTEPYGMYGFDEDITFTVPVLEDGQNDYEVKVVDLAGNETTADFSIFKEETVEVVTFSDIQGHFAQERIEDLATIGIIKGKSPGLFAPYEDLTRAEYAVLLVKTLNLDLEAYEGTFSDVTEGHWAHQYIEAAARAGIIYGNTNGTYSPNAEISRQDTAVMVIRAVEYQDASLLEGLDSTHQYVDSNKVQAYAKDAVAQAYELGLMTGRQNNYFVPHADITRGEAAVVIHRAWTLMGLW